MISPRVPINNPCPCGSGRKYKNCCWKREKREYAVGRNAIGKAIDGVLEQIETEEDDTIGEIVAIILDNMMRQYGQDQIKEVLDEERLFFSMCVNEICAADFPLENDKRVIDLYIEKQKKPLHPMALEFLEKWKQNPISLYEVRSVQFRKSLGLFDMFRNRNVTAVSSKLSEHAQQGDTFFARLVPVGDENLLGLTLLPVEPLLADDIVDEIRDLKNNTPGSATLTWKKFFRKHWYYIPELWIQLHLLDYEPTELHNTDGDPISAFRITCDLDPGKRFQVNAILSSVEGMEKVSTEAFNYVVEASENNQTPLENVVMSTLDLSENTLTAEVNSHNRADRMTVLLKKWLGNLIVDMDREPIEFDPRAAQKHFPPEDEIPPEMKEKILLEVFDKHMKSWIDDPIPALDGLTPRKAVKKAKPRKKVIALLRDFEAGPPPGCESYDFSWIWKELGLKRKK